MMSIRSILLSLCCCLPLLGWSQCREEAAWAEAWTSCQVSPNPNAARGEGHWLRYDLGHLYPLKSLHVWNANQVGQTQRGVRRLALDYSLDGQNWESGGEFDLQEAPGNAYYAGERVAELDDVLARYVILTVQETWGDASCASLHEVSFGLAHIPLLEEEGILVYPNPAIDRVQLTYDSPRQGQGHIELVSLVGQRIQHLPVDLRFGPQKWGLSVQDLVPGVYVVQVVEADGQLLGSQKLMIGTR